MPVKANIPQGKFLAMPHKFRAYVAGYGCLRGSTPIMTANGLVPISDINRPTQILSLNEKSNQLEICQGGPSFPKGEDYLYQIATTQEVFVAAGSHRILCADGKYRRVEDLAEGQELFASFDNQFLTNMELDPLSSPEGVSCCNQRHEDLKYHCEDEGRLCGQQPQFFLNTVQGETPQQVDAQGYDLNFYRASTEPLNDLEAQKPTHNRQSLPPYLKHSYRLRSLLGHLVDAVADHVASLRLEYTFADNLKQMKSALMSFRHHTCPLSFQPLRCCAENMQSVHRVGKVFCTEGCILKQLDRHNSLSSRIKQTILSLKHFCKKTFSQDHVFSFKSLLIKSDLKDDNSTTKPVKIISITRENVKEEYWDIQVDKNHNYLTAGGTVHHNSGKTWVGCLAQGIHFLEWPGVNQGYFAPTYGHIRDIYFPTVEESVFDLGLSVEIKESNKEVHFYTGKIYRGTTICRSMDKPGQIIGFKIGQALIDELDVLPTHKGTIAWRKILARMRYNIPGLKNGVDVATTPEGFKFTHKAFVEAPSENPKLRTNYGLIQASTYDNEKNLPHDYISSLVETYPEELIAAYLNGQFVNLTSGTVFRNYDRERCRSKETIQAKEVLNVGLDFNVGNMAACIFVARKNGWHQVDELKDIFDTPDMIKVLKDRFAGHKMVVYPDASGNSRKTVNASKSDIRLITDAGLTVKVNRKNPFVKDRVLATNKQFEAGGLWVNDKMCPSTARCLEQHAYDGNGEPDKKSGFDHQTDSFSYPIVFEFPIVKPTITTESMRF